MSAPTASTDTNVSFASQPRHSAVSWRQPTRTRSTNNKRQPATQPKPSHPHTDRVFSPLLSISQSFPSSLVLSPLPDRSSRLLSYSANSDRSSTDAPYDHPIPADGGARCAFLSIILKGELAVLSSPLGGSTVERIAVLSASDAFGANSLLDGAPRNTSVVCMVECELAILTRRDYLEVLMQRHEDESDMELKLLNDSPDGAVDPSPEPISLLDPEFVTASSLPAGFELTPHLTNYIDILTRQTQQQLKDGMDHQLSAAPPGTLTLTSSLSQLSPQPASSTSTANGDSTFLLNLLKTCKHIQMHDRRSVLLDLTKHLTLHHLPPETVLFEKGSKATYTYFVLSGSIAVMNHTSYAHRHKARLDRRAKRHIVRSIVAKWDEADRRDAAEALRRKEQRPNYMAHTAQFSNALKENAELIAQVQFSTAALEKEADRKEKARLARDARARQVDELMREHGIEHLDSSEDEEDLLARQRRRRMASGDSGGGVSDDDSTVGASAAPPPHQFPLGSCRELLLYPDHIGFSDHDRHLCTLQESSLSSNLAQSEDFSDKELERAAIIAQALAKGQSLGTGAQAAAAASAVIEQQRLEKQRIQALQEAQHLKVVAERNARKKLSGLALSQARRMNKSNGTAGGASDTASGGGHRSRSPSMDRSLASLSTPVNGSSSQLLPSDRSEPLYLSPTFADVEYSMSCVTRESCYVARLPNSALLHALESPYHGVGVTERLNDPVLRYTVLRPQEVHRVAPDDPEDPDAILAEKKNHHTNVANSAAAAASGVRLDYSHHIESLFTSMQHLKFFSIQNRELGLKLCSRMQYLSLNKGDILCKQGQLGSLFYIILSGSISIHIKPQFVVPQLAQTLMAAEARSRLGRKKKKQEATKEATTPVTTTPNADAPPASHQQQHQHRGSVMIQSLMFPSTSPVEQMKQQEREQKEGEAAAALAAATSPVPRRRDERQGSVMIQSLMFPTTSPVEQMKQQEREQKEGEAAAAAAAASSSPSKKPTVNRSGSAMIQSLMFPSTSPVEQMKQQEREQREGEDALRLGAAASTSVVVARKPHVLDAWVPNLSKLLDPPSRIARHLDTQHSTIDELSQIDSLYGPCVKVAVSGDPIGESAIVSSNPRSATCICREPVELFTLSKEDYRAIYAVPQHLKVNTILNLLHKHTDLPSVDEDDVPNLSTKDIVLLEHCIRDIEFMKPLHSSIRSILGQRLHHMQLEAGRVIFEQGTKGHYLYIIVSGTCSVYMKPTPTPAQVAAQAAAQAQQAQTTTATVTVEPPSPNAGPVPTLQRASTLTTRSPSTDSSKSVGIARVQSAAASVLGVGSGVDSSLRPPAATGSRLENIPDLDLPDSSGTPSPSSSTQQTPRTDLEREAHESIDAMETELSDSARSFDKTPPKTARTKHRRSHRTRSSIKRNRVALENSSARPGAEMLSQTGPAAFKFSGGASANSTGGCGRAFSAGRIRASQLEAFPPVTDINLSEQDAAYLHGLGPVSSILSVGSSFGEPALQSTGPGLHTTTVVTNGPTDLLLLTRASYTFALESLAQWKADLDEVFQFLKNSHYFHNWSPTLISKAMNMMERREIKRNEVIVKQGDRASHIFFILKGEIHVTQSMQLVDAEIPDLAHPLSLSKPGASPQRKAKGRLRPNAMVGAAGESGDMASIPEGEAEAKADRTQRDAITIQTILKEQRQDEEALKALEKKGKSLTGPPLSYPIRSTTGIVSSLHRPEHGLPLFVPTITNEEPVPIMPNSSHISNFSSLVTAGQMVDGINPNLPIVDGGQIWLHWPQKLGSSYSHISSGCKRRGAKKIYKNTTNNGTEVALNAPSKKGAPQHAPGTSLADASTGPASVNNIGSPAFPFNVELATLSQNGVCGNLECLLPTILGVKDLLGRPENEEEIIRERERKEREAAAIENGEIILQPTVTPVNVPATATQCQLAYPSTFTAFTDCTLVAFPANAFHTLLSLTEETLFYQLHLDRLSKNVDKIRRWVEGRWLNAPPLTKEILEDFRIFDENIYFSKNRYQPEESVQKEKLNALLRPGIKPPALIDYRTEEQLRELKAAGLSNHPYALNLEARLKNKDTIAPAPVSGAQSSDYEHELSFSLTGNMADNKWSAIMSQYVAPEAMRKPKGAQARVLLDTICQVSQANASLPTVPHAVAAEFGRSTFDPMKQLLPLAASHTPEFQAALKYAEHHVAQRRLGGNNATPTQQTEQRSPERIQRMLHESQSVPYLPPASAPNNTAAVAASAPNTPQHAATVSLNVTPTMNMDMPMSPDSPSSSSGASPLTVANNGYLLCLSPLAKDRHAARFFTKAPIGSRNPNAAAGMVAQLLANEPHELESFLAHVSNSSSDMSNRRKRNKSVSGAVPNEQQDGPNSSPPSTAGGSRPDTSGPKYALTSAVLALQSKSSLHSQQLQAQKQYTQQLRRQQSDKKLESSRIHARAIARALCLPDPYSGDSAGEFAAKHIQHLQKAVRGEVSDARGTHVHSPAVRQIQREEAAHHQYREETKSPQPNTSIAQLSSLSPSDRRGFLLTDDSVDCLSPSDSPTPSRTPLAAYNRAHQRLQAAPRMAASNSMPTLAAAGSDTQLRSPTRGTIHANANTAAALHLLQTALSVQSASLASGGSMSVDDSRSGVDAIQFAMNEEAALARVLGVDANVVHAQAGHAGIHMAQAKKKRAASNRSTGPQPSGPLDFATPMPALMGGFRVPQPNSANTNGAARTSSTVALGDGVSVTLPKLPFQNSN